MKVHKGEFIIVKGEKANSYKLYKVLKADGDKITARTEASKVESKRVTDSIDPANIVTNLGKNCPYGRVYGQLVEPLRGVLKYKKWGEIHFYRRMDKQEKKTLKRALDKVYNEFVKLKLTFVLPITIEIRNKQGRWDGHYKHSSRIDNEHNHLTCFKPPEFTMERCVSLIRHEMAHAIYYLGVPSPLRLKWIKLYMHYLKLHTAKLETIKSLRKGLEKARDLKVFRDSLEGDEDEKFGEADVLDECISFIKSTFNLDTDEVALLIEREDSLETYWPKHPFDLSQEHNYEAVMTEYGMTKPGEFFAEAFRLHLESKSGKKIKKLMLRTLSRLVKT